MNLLNTIGWNDRLAFEFSDFARQSLSPARVIRADRGALLVMGERGSARAVLAGALLADSEPPPAATGDWVAVDERQDTLVVRAIVPRRSALTRRRPGAAERPQVVAANMDIVLIVEGLDRGPNQRRIERGVALAYGGGASPLVVLSKSDLCPDLDDAVARAGRAAPFADVVPVSSTTGAGITALGDRLAEGSSAVLMGPSGAGKSTLANLLTGDQRLAVSCVRDSDRRGRHTTTRAELVVLPGGACLIDTPGLRELGLWLDGDAVEAAFADIEALAEGCRFRDCSHRGEPGCSVAAAVAAGSMEASRLAGFHKLRREAALQEARHDPLLAHQQRARDRSFGKLCRAAGKSSMKR